MNNQELEALRNVSARCVARELAEIAFETYHGSKHPSFPVDIFAVLKHFNIMYKFLPLDNSEGMYIPDKDGSVPVVGIHYHRPYERQRFTAAHELCHHLRDYNTAMASPVGSRHPIEVYANEFAAEFLMPTIYFLEEVDKIVNPSGFVDPEKAISLARVFGVSFESAIRNLHHHGKINFEPTPSFFKSFGVLKKAKDLGIEDLDSTYLRNIIDSYSYIPQADTSPLWQRMKKTLIYHDNKLEGVDMEIEAVAEICNDMRLKLHSSEYYQQYKNNNNIVETVGHIFVYDHVAATKEVPDRYAIKDLNKRLYSLAPSADLMGEYRQTDNEISGAIIQTTQPRLIENDMYQLDKDIDDYISECENRSFVDCMELAVRIHHRLAQIHPFEDGNGRTSRALMNWLLKLKGLPPLYVESESKQEYLEAMKEADGFNYEPLNLLFMRRLLSSMVELNSRIEIGVRSA